MIFPGFQSGFLTPIHIFPVSNTFCKLDDPLSWTGDVSWIVDVASDAKFDNIIEYGRFVYRFVQIPGYLQKSMSDGPIDPDWTT